MSSPELDWTFADAPAEDQPRGDILPSPEEPPPKKQPRGPLLSRRQRRLIAALAAVAGLAGLGLWLFMQLGLRRLQSPLAAQIVYEDERARAGDVPAVLALQASGDVAWRDEQAARARLGLAAPLPAADLRPAGAPPRLLRLDPLGGDLFAATVSRDYLDSAGQTVTFDLVQRYRNLSPGAWGRLPPDASALADTAPFEGQRLLVTVPTDDLPWLGPALLQADDLIVKACADWSEACPPGVRLAAIFGASPDLAQPSLNSEQLPKDSPLIFYLPAALDPNHPAAYILRAPLLVGRPHDAAAQAALAHSLSVQLLGDYAGFVSGTRRTEDDYFLDALVARAEVRHLGASAAPQPVAPQDYVSLAALWAVAGQPDPSGGWRTDLAARREAFDILNYALTGQSPSVDGALLRTLRRGAQGLDEWLATGLADTSPNPIEAWSEQTLAAFAARPVVDWTRYDGLMLACGDVVYQVRGSSAPRIVGGMNTYFEVPRVGDLSPDRRYLALQIDSLLGPQRGAPDTSPSPWTDLSVMDLATGTSRRVFGAPMIVTFGWSASDQLIYTVNSSRLIDLPPKGELPLRGYRPDTATSVVLIPDRVLPDAGRPGLWSADHTRLVLMLIDPQPTLAVLTFGPTLQVTRLAQSGDGVTLSPDGQRVAYTQSASTMGTVESSAGSGAGLIWLNVLDTTTGNVTRLAAANDLGLPVGLNTFWGQRWSPDGSTLAWSGGHMNEGAYLLSVPASGGPVRVWAGHSQQPLTFPATFSPDGRYLQGAGGRGILDLNQYWLFDQQAPGVPAPLAGWAYSTLWAPTGHRLVITGAAGVSAIDPASGQWEWLGPWQNCQLRW